MNAKTTPARNNGGAVEEKRLLEHADQQDHASDLEASAHPSAPRSRTSYAQGILTIALAIFAFSLLRPLILGTLDYSGCTLGSHGEINRSSNGKVNLEAHIMSKCPDARDCLRDLVVPAMANISDEVNFSISYIGKQVDDDNGVECMHGPSECLGNILELCAADLYPEPKTSLGFTNCLTMNYTQIPQKELVKDCSLEHGLDFDTINKCASEDDGVYGLDLLRNSVARSHNAGVTKSCTVRLNGKIRCVRDGGKWKDCDGGHKPKDLIKDIRAISGLRNMEDVPIQAS